MDKHIKELRVLLGFFFLYPWMSTGYVMSTLKLDGNKGDTHSYLPKHLLSGNLYMKYKIKE